MAKGDDILERLIKFGVEVMKIGNSLPKTSSGRHVTDQLIRSATAGAPNYAEARSGESIRDFVHKLGIVRKELNESLVWLRMLGETGMTKQEHLDALLIECDELCRIIAASKITAEQRFRNSGSKPDRF
jgi:four helix bundle protein